MANEGIIYTKHSGIGVKDGDGLRMRVDGSKGINRDLSRTFNSWRPMREPPRIPDGKNWCAHPYHEGYDEHGQDDGGWRPNAEFTEYTDARGKKRKHEHCKTCRARHQRKMYALQREAAGQPVRGWRRQEQAS